MILIAITYASITKAIIRAECDGSAASAFNFQGLLGVVVADIKYWQTQIGRKIAVLRV